MAKEVSDTGIMQTMHKTLILFLALLLFPAAASAKPEILLIESYHSDFFWDAEIVEGLRSVLKDTVELARFELDTKRLPEEEHENRAEMAWEYYLKTSPDIVVLSDDNAMRMLGKKFLKTDTPVVFLGVNENPRKYIQLRKNITGVLERLPFKRMLLTMKDLSPQKNSRILILFDNSSTAKTIINNEFKGQNSFDLYDLHCNIVSTPDLAELKEAVLTARSNGYSYIILGLFYHLFDNGVHVDSEQVLQWIYQNTPLPLFSFWGVSVGKGRATGGIIMNGKIQGGAAGKIIQEIINGREVSSITPVTPDNGSIIFSRHELDRWKIRLPRNTLMRTILVE
ncbi:ABC transporter substrate binding protein [Maridesulfovibrio sp.]|uniref:ABC transporter substrate-binding protein n=1 Tax=Maridesulfovibrio sp. TaxID=2795000 RepID=UPI002A1877EF|nr:ABC transporter substrate binding protein [Maridesulfovibrio sp.]